LGHDARTQFKSWDLFTSPRSVPQRTSQRFRAERPHAALQLHPSQRHRFRYLQVLPSGCVGRVEEVSPKSLESGLIRYLAIRGRAGAPGICLRNLIPAASEHQLMIGDRCASRLELGPREPVGDDVTPRSNADRISCDRMLLFSCGTRSVVQRILLSWS
jgi:hypothetical protein